MKLFPSNKPSRFLSGWFRIIVCNLSQLSLKNEKNIYERDMLKTFGFHLFMGLKKTKKKEKRSVDNFVGKENVGFFSNYPRTPYQQPP